MFVDKSSFAFEHLSNTNFMQVFFHACYPSNICPPSICNPINVNVLLNILLKGFVKNSFNLPFFFTDNRSIVGIEVLSFYFSQILLNALIID